MKSNAALGEFLRLRRQRTTPGEAGIVSTRRRVVSGLRRDELARLAGMSVDYYTRLEQGRHPTPSSNVLDAIARALRLPEADRRYLHRLATPAPRPTSNPSVVRPETRHLMRALDPSPALLLSFGFDVVATNRGARLLYTDFAALPPRERNLIRWMLTDPAARPLHGDDWARITADLIGVMRLFGSERPDVRRLAAEMAAVSDLFRRVWAEQAVSLADRGHKRLHHPWAGTVEFGVTYLHVRDPGEHVLMVLTPEPESEHERAWRAAYRDS
ncbi:helix-turn-helix domain-containing protein [Actinoplanes sp. TBRC 11911]|uniref:helix-turn-helix transcriptional regulator n=1 Tax=Actinoplanes sp. TBRC 11911 TaxID=2729386 RepID=UPI00145FB657|nr:helix-turn-helix transcriptional regulator [Actinoplanes sp. TBRC 11911]NMO49831.1 helix-turn-helix domain-containing protein [Actinoplanes sp. TBRC 11911]